ncbi:response regulator [Solirubrobacter phytolaccae]|uniref:Response regulator n=1 Tax=Solirubrobacter phytolaccae TaxID=1404360 RepID=A0A9X3SC60_9ACTN|nr:response regulator [Solirubrobacter phytolaccae]MDA0178757.1 response regulator [Solirubrobacter phytolaccae]
MPVRVLLIDDDASFRSLARGVLAASGLTVIGEAGTAADGALVAVALQPDAILLDVNLPDGDGVTLAAELCGLDCKPRVLLTSSDPDATTTEDAIRRGACGFVRKHDLVGEGTDLLAG